jgi:hypothetical protein
MRVFAPMFPVYSRLSEKNGVKKSPFPPFPIAVPFAALERRMSGKRTTEPALLLKESWDALDYLERKQERLILHGSFHIACSR